LDIWLAQQGSFNGEIGIKMCEMWSLRKQYLNSTKCQQFNIHIFRHSSFRIWEQWTISNCITTSIIG